MKPGRLAILSGHTTCTVRHHSPQAIEPEALEKYPFVYLVSAVVHWNCHFTRRCWSSLRSPPFLPGLHRAVQVGGASGCRRRGKHSARQALAALCRHQAEIWCVRVRVSVHLCECMCVSLRSRVLHVYVRARLPSFSKHAELWQELVSRHDAHAILPLDAQSDVRSARTCIVRHPQNLSAGGLHPARQRLSFKPQTPDAQPWPFGSTRFGRRRDRR